jgi:hypothetical protein
LRRPAGLPTGASFGCHWPTTRSSDTLADYLRHEWKDLLKQRNMGRKKQRALLECAAALLDPAMPLARGAREAAAVEAALATLGADPAGAPTAEALWRLTQAIIEAALTLRPRYHENHRALLSNSLAQDRIRLES